MFNNGHIHKLLALWVAFMLLVAPAGVTCNVHLCKGSIKSISLFGTAKGCNTDSFEACTMPKAPSNAAAAISKKPCCANHSYYNKANIATDGGSATHTVAQWAKVLPQTVIVPTATMPLAQSNKILPLHPLIQQQSITILYQNFRT